MNSINSVKKTVCSVGSGAAGMTCGHLLKKYFNVIILEACETFGGRVRSLKGFCDREIELGGEEIHGNKTFYYKLAKEAGAEIFPAWEENTYSEYKGEFNDIKALSENHIDLKNVWDLFEEIEETTYNKNEDYPDISVKEYLKNKGIPDDLDFLANAMFAIECGTDLDKLSIGGFSSICKKWKAGEDNYMVINMSHTEILKKSFINIVNDIQFNKQITKIEYKGETVVLYDQNYTKYSCDYCIITVPVTQIKKLNFEPILSQERIDCFNKLDMDNLAKLVLKFKKPFWPEDTSWIILPGYINVFWTVVTCKNSNEFVLTGMTSGGNARELNKLHDENKEKFIKRVIDDLEKSTKCTIMNNLIDYFWFDWKNVPFIEGGYTYPAIGEGNARDIIREPVENKLFFAGEAYARDGHIATIHGAIETSLESVRKIKKLNNFNK